MATIWKQGASPNMFDMHMRASSWLVANVGPYHVYSVAQRFAITESETLFRKWNQALIDYEIASAGLPALCTNKLEIRCYDATLWQCYYCINTHDTSPDADNGAEVLIVVNDDILAVQLKLFL
jgi:hypothetical protein